MDMKTILSVVMPIMAGALCYSLGWWHRGCAVDRNVDAFYASGGRFVAPPASSPRIVVNIEAKGRPEEIRRAILSALTAMKDGSS